MVNVDKYADYCEKLQSKLDILFPGDKEKNKYTNEEIEIAKMEINGTAIDVFFNRTHLNMPDELLETYEVFYTICQQIIELNRFIVFASKSVGEPRRALPYDDAKIIEIIKEKEKMLNEKYKYLHNFVNNVLSDISSKQVTRS